MINSKRSGRGWRGGRRIAVLVSLACAGGVLLGSTGSASASTVICNGKVAPLNKKRPGIDAKLEFTCNETIRGYSVLTNKRFDFFGTEEEVYNPDGSGSSQSATLQCEGHVPGPGFGCGIPNRNTPGRCEEVLNSGAANQSVNPPCTQEVSANLLHVLQVGFPQNPCKPAGLFAPHKDPFRVWLFALTEPLIGAFDTTPPLAPDSTTLTRGTYISAPFKISTKRYCANAPDPSKKKGKAKPKGKKASLGSVVSRAVSWF